jgi:hypothetical protein
VAIFTAWHIPISSQRISSLGLVAVESGWNEEKRSRIPARNKNKNLGIVSYKVCIKYWRLPVGEARP